MVRDGDGNLIFSNEKGQAFLREVWQRRAGASTSSPAGETSLRCDALGCIYRSQDRTVAFIKDTAAFAEDCAMADVIVSWTTIRNGRCIGPALRIDRRALAAGGGHALWLTTDEPPRVEAVRDSRGNRPWSALR